MAWIKKNPHLATLLVVALLVVAGSGLIANSARNFDEKFKPVQEQPPESVKTKEPPPLAMTRLEEAQKELEQPFKWTASLSEKPVLVPVRYIFDPAKDQFPKIASGGESRQDPLSKKGIPNKWFIDNRLNFTDPNVVNTDADGDGFTNADEWRGNTNPNSKESHPPYHTKLWLKRFEKVPFLLKFNAYDGDPVKDKPEDLTFQINTLTVRTPSVFRKIGDNVAGEKYKIIKFEYKKMTDANGVEKDVSELTLEKNDETKDKVVLIYNTRIDSPDSFALFDYQWPGAAGDIRVPKGKEFVLRPVIDQRYRLLDINEQAASIQTPSGEKVSITPHP
jgi:hypothetical protein